MIKEQFSASLEERRKELGMSISALAKRAGLSRHTVTRMLRDDSTDFTFSNLLAVAGALGTSFELREIPAEKFKDQVATMKADRAIRLTQGNVALESHAISKKAIRLRTYDAKSRIASSNRKLWSK